MKLINNAGKECNFAEINFKIIDERYRDKLISSLVAQGLTVYQNKDTETNQISVVALIDVSDIFDSVYNH